MRICNVAISVYIMSVLFVSFYVLCSLVFFAFDLSLCKSNVRRVPSGFDCIAYFGMEEPCMVAQGMLFVSLPFSTRKA